MCGKRCYPDKRAAVTMASVRMRSRRCPPAQLRAYYCDYCHGWHLTKKEYTQ